MAQKSVIVSYLELQDPPIQFQTVNPQTSVFFDDSKKQIFTIRSGDGMTVSVKGPKHNSVNQKSFRIEDRGAIQSIKFSLDGTVLAIQRTQNSVEFANYEILVDKLSPEYSQSCRKNSKILGFIWTARSQFVAYITDNGVESYHVYPEKRSFKMLKSVQASVQWFLWNNEGNLALLAFGNGTQMQPILFKDGVPSRLPKVELGLGKTIFERDVTLALLNSVPAILLLNHGDKTTGNAEVYIYQTPNASQPMKLMHILPLQLFGRFAINVFDNLICVHHQATKTTHVFDVGVEEDLVPKAGVTAVIKHTPILPPRSFKQPIMETSTNSSVNPPCELYSTSWVVFQPNIIIDTKLGYLWYMTINLDVITTIETNLEKCVRILRRRSEGKTSMSRILKSALKENSIEGAYALELAVSPPKNEPHSDYVTLDQNDVYALILSDLEPEPQLLISYMRALRRMGQAPLHHLSELLVTTLVRRGDLEVLLQLIRCGALCDSKPLACLLLSLGNLHQAFTQLALDMLTRCNGVEEIQEVLFSSNEVISACKYVTNCEQKSRTNNSIVITKPSARKLLDATKFDANLYHTFYRNYRTQLSDHHVDYYDQIHKTYFD